MRKFALLLLIPILLASCSRKKSSEMTEEAPPPAVVVHESNSDLVKVDHSERFPLVAAGEHESTPLLNVTGFVGPDVSRQVPVISLASGRVVKLAVKLGDAVRKGEFMMQVRSSDIGGAFSDYRKAVADEKLARIQYDRAKRLHEKGVIALNDLQVAQDAAEKAGVDLETLKERLETLGSEVDHPSTLVNIYAPASGVITDEQVTLSSAIQAFSSANPLTISDLSHVWILCDVYENDMSFVEIGQSADIRFSAYPGKVWQARIINIGPILDPSNRTTKVRLELENPGSLRVGMFATATFHGKNTRRRAAVPASAIVHLHDRDWVYVPSGDRAFRRIQVIAGEMVDQNMQEILSGIAPGQKVVAKALILEGNNQDP